MKKGFWRNRRWILIPVIAVCLCVLAAAGINTLKRLDYNTVIGAPGDGEQSVWLGSISEDKYYYFVEYDGVWSYDLKTGLREKKADTYWIDSWQVNEYGIYYEQGRTFGVIPHDTGKRQVLYKGRWPSCDKLRFKILQDGNVILTELNIGRKIRTEYLLEGRTGELLATVLEPAKYEDIVLSCSEAYFQVGDRELMLVPTGETEDGDADSKFWFDLQENGKSILPEGMLVRKDPEQLGDNLWFTCKGDLTNVLERVLIVRPDGEDGEIFRPSGYYTAGTDDYAFYPNEKNNGVCCLDAAAGITWELASSSEYNIYSMETDGTWLFTYGMDFARHHVQWKILYDDKGRPAALELVNEDFGKEHRRV